MVANGYEREAMLDLNGRKRCASHAQSLQGRSSATSIASAASEGGLRQSAWKRALSGGPERHRGRERETERDRERERDCDHCSLFAGGSDRLWSPNRVALLGLPVEGVSHFFGGGLRPHTRCISQPKWLRGGESHRPGPSDFRLGSSTSAGEPSSTPASP